MIMEIKNKLILFWNNIENPDVVIPILGAIIFFITYYFIF